MTPKSTVEQVMALAMGTAKPIAPDARGPESRRALMYYENPPIASGTGNNGQAITYQANDLTQRLRAQHADPAIWDALPKNCVNVVRPATDTLCTLYHDPVTYGWDEKDEKGKLAKSLWEKYALQSPHLAAMKIVDRKTFLGGLAVPRPVVQERLRAGVKTFTLKHAIYTQDQVEYTQAPDDPNEAQEVVFSFTTGQGGAANIERHAWSDDYLIECNERNTVKQDPNRPGHINPYGLMPFVIFRNQPPDGDFYGTPATDLVESQMGLNDLLTGYKDTVIVQGSGTLYVINGPKNLKVGRRALIEAQVPPNAGTFEAGYVQSGTNFAAWVEAINLQITLMLLSRRVPESEVMAKQNGESGVSLVALAASLAAYRKERIATFRPLDARLVAVTLRVRHFHETGQLIDFPEPTITYTELKAPMSQDTRDEIDWLEAGGYISKEEAMMRLNPGMGADEAKDKIAANLKAKRERVLASMPKRPGFGDKGEKIPPEDDEDAE